MPSYEGPRVYKRKDRKNWNVRIDGERKSTGFKTKRAAQLKAAELERRAADPAYAASAETTLDDCLKGFRSDRRSAGRPESTIEYYRDKHSVLVTLLGPDTPLAHLTRERVRAFIDERRTHWVVEPDPARGREGRRVSEACIGKELGALRAALRWARSEGLFSGDVARLFPAGFDHDYEPGEVFHTPEQAWALVRALEGQRARGDGPGGRARAAHVAFLFGAAARLEESRRAERGDVDLRRGVVYVRGTKTKKARRRPEVPVVAPARPFLEYALKNAPGGDAGPLFAPWPSPHEHIARACRRAGVPEVSPNDCRRSLPTWCVRAGVPLELVAELLRHADTKMVYRVYGVPDAEATRANIDRHFAAAGPERKAG